MDTYVPLTRPAGRKLLLKKHTDQKDLDQREGYSSFSKLTKDPLMTFKVPTKKESAEHSNHFLYFNSA